MVRLVTTHPYPHTQPYRQVAIDASTEHLAASIYNATLFCILQYTTHPHTAPTGDTLWRTMGVTMAPTSVGLWSIEAHTGCDGPEDTTVLESPANEQTSDYELS